MSWARLVTSLHARGGSRMANEKWDKASIDEKLELLREDIQKITDAYNYLRRDHNDLLGRVRQLEQEVKDMRPKN
jgi:polyhydroxyalkanoate synthesis regulator phasin